MTFEEWLKKSSFVIPDPTVYQWLKDCWEAAYQQGLADGLWENDQ